MRSLRCFVTAAAMGGMMVIPHTGWASPLPSSLATVVSKAPIVSNLVLQVHGWHCSRKKGWYKGDKVWHRHPRACQETLEYDDDYFDEDFRYSRGPPNLYINREIRLHFGNQGDN